MIPELPPLPAQIVELAALAAVVRQQRTAQHRRQSIRSERARGDRFERSAIGRVLTAIPYSWIDLEVIYAQVQQQRRAFLKNVSALSCDGKIKVDRSPDRVRVCRV